VTRPVLVVVGVVVLLLGLLFTLQGVGVIGGSPMSGTTTWSVLGPVIALAGALLALAGRRRGRGRGRPGAGRVPD
jgi:hypothetical protein